MNQPPVRYFVYGIVDTRVDPVNGIYLSNNQDDVSARTGNPASGDGSGLYQGNFRGPVISIDEVFGDAVQVKIKQNGGEPFENRDLLNDVLLKTARNIQEEHSGQQR